MIALSTGSLYTCGIARVFGLACEAGFEGIEVLIDRRQDCQHAGYLKSLQQASHLPIVALHSPFFPDMPGWPADSLGRLRRTLQLAEAVGAPLVVAHPPLRFGAVCISLLRRSERLLLKLPIPTGMDAPYREFIRTELLAHHRTATVKVALETMPRRIPWRFGPQLWHLNAVPAWTCLPSLTLDTTHIGTWGYDLLGLYEALRDRIDHVHLANFDGREHRLPMDGHLPLPELLQRLKRDGYGGAITVETHPGPLGAEDPVSLRARLRQTYDFYARHFY